MTSESKLAAAVVQEATYCLDYGLEKIRHCLDQLDDSQVWWRPRDEMNSIANLLLHLAGNLRQWIVSGTGDLEDTRQRQQEFDDRSDVPKQQLLNHLCEVLEEARAAMSKLSTEDLLADRRIQGHEVTKLGAIWQSITHYQGHVQEIISMTRQQLGPEYQLQWEPQSKEEGG